MARPQLLVVLLVAFGFVDAFHAQTLPDPSAQLAGRAGVFERNHLLQIDIQMSPEHWQEVRLSHRQTSGTGISPDSDDAYQRRPGELRIDGVSVGRVGVRKKGFLGSVVSTRPSLKLKLDEYVPGQEFAGLDGLTLNNNNQDQAMVQQVMAYDLYARAGVPASRASFAQVRVNGEDLGIYTHVEPVGKRFLRRAFGSDTGVLYESYAGDFTAAGMTQFVEKSGNRNQDRTRIGRLRDLLAEPGPIALARVDAIVDLESFIRMWAIESLMGHWDSYSGNRNNYYVYAHHTTGKLHFIPWGPDSVFADPGPLQTKVVPKSFKAEGMLARRLWELPEIRERYRTVMRQLLAGPWTEARVLSEMRDLQRTLQPRSTLLPATVERAAAVIEAFVKQRRADVEAELKEPAPVWPSAVATAATPEPLVFTGSFVAPWNETPPVDPFAGGTGVFSLQVGSRPRPAFDRVGGYATTFTQSGELIGRIRERYHGITLTGLSGTTVWQVMFAIDPFLLASRPGNLAIDLYEVWAIVVTKEGPAPARTNIFGSRGELRLEEASARPGGQIRGTFALRAPTAP